MEHESKVKRIKNNILKVDTTKRIKVYRNKMRIEGVDFFFFGEMINWRVKKWMCLKF